MRLTDAQRRAIAEETARLLGPVTRIRLFGSRVDDSAQRTRTLIETGLQEARLQHTDDRRFAQPLSLDAIRRLPQHDDLRERIDAFVARFGRLQDTIGDKLLPVPSQSSLWR